MSVASFQSRPIFAPDDDVFSRRLPAAAATFVFRVTVPIFGAPRSGPVAGRSTVVSFGVTHLLRRLTPETPSIAARPLTIAEPGGRTYASSV